MLDRLAETAGSFVGTLASIVGLILLLGVSSHAVTWLITRRRTLHWVWTYWSVVGSVLLAAGFGAIGYAWLVLGFQTLGGSLLAGLGMLLASAGLWMMLPV
jgi:hypothetical protein